MEPTRLTRPSPLLLAVALLALPACSGNLFSGPPPALPGSGSPPQAPPGRAPVSQRTPKDRAKPTLRKFTPKERERIVYVQPWVDKAATRHRLEPSMINAVIWVESRFNPRAKSPAGARGLMQLMPATAAALARAMGRHRAASYDPEFNIAAGSMYLAKMRGRYDGDLRLALAAYNAGAGNVDKWMKQGGLPPRSEHYVQLVMDAKARFEAVRVLPPQTMPDTRLAKAKVDRPKAVEPKPKPESESEPEPVVPEPPVRYDLDRVESTYAPKHEPEPPIERPRRRAARPKATEPKPETKPRPASTPEPKPASIPDVGIGKLPSVLD